jgi:predicted metal-binding membrane protein
MHLMGSSVINGALGRALRRDRLIVVASLVTVVVLSWTYILSGAGMSMDAMLVTHREPWTLRYAGLMLLMWSIMMAAMMLPSAAPVILLYGTISTRRRAAGEHVTGAGLFVLGYVAIWALFSMAATALQFGLEKATLLSPMMAITSVAAAGVVLVAAGVYQWTPLKQACLRRCRSPLEFLIAEWRTGPLGSLTMGVRHGIFCVGCCWLLMLLLFIGGIMNLAWIAGLALFALLEKLASAGHWISRGAGAGLMVWGGATLLSLR